MIMLDIYTISEMPLSCTYVCMYIYIHIYGMYNINAFYMSIYLWGCIEKLHAYLLCIGLLVLPLEVKPPKKWDVQPDAKGFQKLLSYKKTVFVELFGGGLPKKVHYTKVS